MAFRTRRPGPPSLLQSALLLGALLLGGCATRTPPPAPQGAAFVPPANWSTAPLAGPATSASALVAWWQRFGDAPLDSLVAQALQANTSVTGAMAALQQARALRDVAAAGLLPSLGSSASAQRSRANSRNGNSFSAGLDASWEPDFFGAQRSGLDATEATAGASAASLGDVQVSVSAEVALNYLTLRSTQARLAIARDNLASQQQTLQITLWRQQAGLVTALEAAQAQASVDQLRAQLPGLQTTLAQSRHALAVLTGRPPAALDAELAGTAPVPQAAGDLALAFPAETLRQRPDVRAAELQASAAWARVAQADAARYPSFKLSGSLGLNAATLGALGNGAALAASVLAGVSWPVFDGGAANAQLRAQQAAYAQAQSSHRAAVLTALQDVENALQALQGDRERLARLQDAASAAAQAAQLARQRYSSGLVDFQTVLETQRTQLSTQDSLASAQADVSADHVRLFKALGGGWQADAALPPTSTASSQVPTRP